MRCENMSSIRVVDVKLREPKKAKIVEKKNATKTEGKAPRTHKT